MMINGSTTSLGQSDNGIPNLHEVGHAELVERRRIEFLVPVADNSTALFPPAYFDALDQFLLRLAGGFTDDGMSRGGWLSFERKPVFDRSIRYHVTVSIDRAPIAARQIETLVKVLFAQDAVALDIVPVFTTNY